jgi:hypothetical protein
MRVQIRARSLPGSFKGGEQVWHPLNAMAENVTSLRGVAFVAGAGVDALDS